MARLFTSYDEETIEANERKKVVVRLVRGVRVRGWAERNRPARMKGCSRDRKMGERAQWPGDVCVAAGRSPVQYP